MKSSRSFIFYKQEMDPLTWESLVTLVDRFYGLGNISTKETSSHWVKFGNTQEVEHISDFSLSVQGFGFGDYENSTNLTILGKLKSGIPTVASKIAILALSKLLRNTSKELAYTTERLLNPDFIRLAKSATRISEYINVFGMKRVLIIGDGWGTLGCLLKALHPEITIIQVNLGRSLLFDMAFSVKAQISGNHELISSLSSVHEAGFYYLPAEDTKVIDAEIDLFVSIESFQEMDIKVIKDYFNLMRKQSADAYLYSANRLSKVLPDGSEIRKEDYGWKSSDKTLFARNPWWLNWGIRRRPLFIFKMDGKIEEALVQISRQL